MSNKDYEDWLPEHEDDGSYGSYDENYDNQPPLVEEDLDLPTGYALEAPQTPAQSEDWLAWGNTLEDPMDRYCFLYWA